MHFFLGPETVRPSGPSGMVHSTNPCGPSSCGERSTWASWPKWDNCRRFAWWMEVRGSGRQLAGRPPEKVSRHYECVGVQGAKCVGGVLTLRSHTNSAECQIVTPGTLAHCPIKSLFAKGLTLCHRVAELAPLACTCHPRRPQRLFLDLCYGPRDHERGPEQTSFTAHGDSPCDELPLLRPCPARIR